jgi:hypothetical protein
MEIIPIFDNLFAFKYKNEATHELERLLGLWQDTEFLEEFFNDNLGDLQREIWKYCSVENAIIKTLQYARDFQKKLVELSLDDSSSKLNTLESLFQPLSSIEHRRPFNKSKAVDNWLRLYGLRADKDVYVITGGAIKLTRTMQERNHTNIELKKIESCRDYLLEYGIYDSEGLIELIENK